MTKYKKYLYLALVFGCLLTSSLSLGAVRPEVVYADAASCETSGGEWIEATERVGGITTDGSFCRCPDGLRLIDGSCITGSSSGGVGAGTDQTFNEDSSVIGNDTEDDCEETPLNRDNCGIINLLVIGINFLSAIAGIAIVVSLMIAGYQYMTARDNAGQIEKAKSRIIQTLIALTLFIFMYALLNFLVPGGVL